VERTEKTNLEGKESGGGSRCVVVLVIVVVETGGLLRDKQFMHHHPITIVRKVHSAPGWVVRGSR
jgi:hypothetical protein